MSEANVDRSDGLQLVKQQEQAVEVFRTELTGICGQFQVEPVRKRRTLLSHLSVRQVEGLEFAQVGLDADHVVRGQQDIRRDPGNHFFLNLAARRLFCVKPEFCGATD